MKTNSSTIIPRQLVPPLQHLSPLHPKQVAQCFPKAYIAMKTQAMNAITTTLAIIAILAVAMNCSAQDCDPDPMAAVGAAMIVGGQSTGGVPQQINDNGRNVWVTSDGKGSGVIYQDRGPTYIQKMGDTTFIIPTANPPASQRNRQR
jgi:hypothetical protein